MITTQPSNNCPSKSTNLRSIYNSQNKALKILLFLETWIFDYEGATVCMSRREMCDILGITEEEGHKGLVQLNQDGFITWQESAVPTESGEFSGYKAIDRIGQVNQALRPGPKA